ncbi:hypothetical protein W822_15460 [Advenella kashmirensis W13003]|uniref:Uncharacterized protein n=2 Tax=Advenella kashmirensis TaxID=310575 RepID=V8QRZ6_9BURK|nr:hypothetical protein W822_15460 [Advenella kashmirensis W13003]
MDEIAIGCGAKAETTNAALSSSENPHEQRDDVTRPDRALDGKGAVAIGHDAYSNVSSISVGGGAKAKGPVSVAVGEWAYSEGPSSVALGMRTHAKGNASLAVGRGAVANGALSQAIGATSAATGLGAQAIGYSATATGARSIALGAAARDPNVPTGRYTEAMATKAEGTSSIAIGSATKTIGKDESKDAVAIGTSARVSGVSGVALGKDATVTRMDAVALGSGSTTDLAATAVTQATVGGRTYSGFAGVATSADRVVSVGAAGAERQLKNVASGEISASSTDAINGSQLYAAMNQAASSSGSWKLQANGDTASTIASGATVQFLDGANIDVTRNGNNVTIATSPALTANSLTINNGGPVLNGTGLAMGNKKITGVANGTNPNDAVNFSQLGAVKTIADSAKTEAAKGWNLRANGDAASKIALGGTVEFLDGTNIDITRSGNSVTIATSPALTADSLSINNGGPILNGTGLAMGNKKITGLANGTNPNDAVNVSQLRGVKSAADNALTQATRGWNLQANGDAASKVAPGNTVQFLDGTNIDITRDGNNITVATTANLKADSLTINNGGPVLNADGIAMSDKKITGLANGTDSNDAVNVSQLTGVKTVADKALTEASKGWNLQANGDSTSKVVPGGTIQFLDGTNIDITREGNDITIATSPNLTADSLAINNGGPVISGTGVAMAGKKIVGLADGVDAHDAVNVSQLNAVSTMANKALTESSKGWSLQANGDTASKVAHGDTVQFLDGTNIDITRDGNNITVATAPNLKADSLTINNGGPVINGEGINMSNKKLTNVAPGTLAADSKDGVNASQLFAVGNSTASSLGGESAFNPETGAVTAALKLTEGNQTFNNVNDALNAVNTQANKGFNLQANGDAASKVAPGDTVQFLDGTNIDITRDGNNITVATAPNLTADSLTINNGGPVINVDGINMSNKKLTNVAPGALAADSKDGVNASQLFAVGNSTASSLGGDSTFNPETGVVTAALKLTEGNQTFNNVNDALNAVNTQANKGWNLQLNDEAASKVAPGDTVKLANGTNISITKDGDAISIATTPALTADSLTINNGGPVIDGTGINMSNKKLTNVAPGTLAADSKDGVNASQLFAVGNSTASSLGGDSAFNPETGMVTAALKLTEGDQTFDNVNDALNAVNGQASKGWNLQANGDTASKVAPGDTVQFLDGTNIDITRDGNNITVATAPNLTADSLTINNGGPVINVGGINMSDKKLTNVAPGTLSADSKDGVNASQLFAVGNSTANSLGGDSTFNPETGVVTAALKLTEGDQTFDNVNDALNAVNGQASKGWNLQANGDTASKVAPGDTVQFLDGTNIDITRDGNNITVATTADLKADSLTINNGGPVVNGTGINMSDKKLTNVAPGTLSADSKDGVNASQLFAVGNSTASSLGGDSTFNPETGVVTAALKLTEGDQTFDNVNDALNAVNSQANKGWNLQANGDTASKVVPGDTVQFLDGTNINIARDGNNVTVATAPNLTADSLTINKGGPVINVDGINMSDKKLTNVAAGTLSVDSKDGVNASQLFAVGNSTASSLGGDSAFNPETGMVTAALKLTEGDLTFNNVNDALNAVNTQANKGWNLQLNDEVANKVAPGDTVKLADGTNISITKDGDAVSIATKPDLTADSLTINNGGPVINVDGINMSNKKLTNVAPGTLSADSKDGVNGSQLFAVGNSTASSLGGDSTFNPETGVVTAALKLTEGDQTFDNVNDALNAVNGQANKGWNLQANGDTASKVAPGDTVQFLDGTNIDITRDGNNITVATAPNLTADSMTINNDGPVINVDGINMSNKKLTNVAPGALAADSKDGVNASQLFAVGNSTASSLGGGSTFNPETGVVAASLKVGENTFTNVNDALDDLNSTLASTTAEAAKGWNLQLNDEAASKVAPGDTVKLADGTNISITKDGDAVSIATTPDLTADSLTINNGGPVINGDGINMSDKKLTNVAPGTLSADSKDGVNASQLFAVGNSTASSLGGDSTFNPETGVVTASLKLTEGNQTFDNVNDALNAVNNQANKGFNLQANGDTASKVAPGDTVQFLDGTNIDITRDGSNITVATTADLTADSLTINNGGPVINSTGINMSDKKFTNVAPGTLSADSKDGVNASQLFAVGNSTASSLGGDSAFDPATGVVTASLKVGDSTFTNVNDALDDLHSTLTSTTAEAAKGWNLQLNDEAASKVAPGDTVKLADGTNISITKDGDAVSIATTPDLTADSLTINNGGPVINGDGINMSDKKLTNVAPGTLSADSKDGVNGGQLFAVGNSTASSLGGDSRFDPKTGTVTAALKLTEGNQTFDNVNDALNAVNTQANKGFNLQANGDAASKVAPGDTVQLLDGTNIDITRDGNVITIATSPDLTADSLTINNGGPVLNSTGIDMSGKKITNVGAGTLSVDSKDGVNASQLFAVGNSTANSLGGNSAFDPATGVVTASLKVGENTFSNVNDALGDLHTSLTETTAVASKGWSLQANGDTASKVAPGDTVQFLDGTNIDITRDGNVLTIATSPDLTADSLTINNGGPALSGTGLDMSGKKLTHVGAGTLSADSTDGVNASQLFAVGNSTAAALGGDSKFDAETGSVIAGLKIDDQTYKNVNDALNAINTNVGAVARRGWDIADAGGIVGTVGSGGQVQFVAGNTNTKVDVTQENGIAKVSVSAAASPLQYSQTANANGKNDPVTDPFGKTNSVTLVGQDGAAPVSLNNVAKATLSEDSLQAVNGSQLHGLGQSIASTLGGDTRFNAETGKLETKINVGGDSYNTVTDALNGIGATASQGWQLQVNNDDPQKVAPGSTVGFNQGSNIQLTRDGNSVTIATAPNVTFESVKTGKLEGDSISAKSYLGVIDGPALTQSGIDAAGKRITNVQAGEIAEGSTDAVNGGQLHSLASGTASAINNLQGNLDRVAKDANAGSATAGAMANLPQAYLPGKSMFALATARYVGQQGFAAGLSKVSDNGNWIIKGSVSGNTRGKTMIGAGIGYQW